MKARCPLAGFRECRDDCALLMDVERDGARSMVCTVGAVALALEWVGKKAGRLDEDVRDAASSIGWQLEEIKEKIDG